MAWIADTCRRIDSLRGAYVDQAVVVEMALIDRGPDGLPVFRHEAMPFVQAALIELKLNDGRCAFFSNYQNDGDFPISLEIRGSPSIEDHWGEATSCGDPSIYRFAPDADFLLGSVTSVDTGLNSVGDIFEIRMTIDGRAILLRAGEVIEHSADRFAACDLAGSILLFPDARASEATRFNETISWRA